MDAQFCTLAVLKLFKQLEVTLKQLPVLNDFIKWDILPKHVPLKSLHDQHLTSSMHTSPSCIRSDSWSTLYWLQEALPICKVTNTKQHIIKPLNVLIGIDEACELLIHHSQLTHYWSELFLNMERALDRVLVYVVCKLVNWTEIAWLVRLLCHLAFILCCTEYFWCKLFLRRHCYGMWLSSFVDCLKLIKFVIFSFVLWV